jgi:hypothetical protein
MNIETIFEKLSVGETIKLHVNDIICVNVLSFCNIRIPESHVTIQNDTLTIVPVQKDFNTSIRTERKYDL